MKQICSDLATEQEELDVIVAGIDERGWSTMTSADGWNIREQIRHLAYYEERARLAASEPQAFKKWLTDMMQDLKRFEEHIKTTGANLSSKSILNWWRTERKALLEILERMDPKHRLSWYGPDMSAISFATARLMETWAHGQDIVDALGLTRKPTDRLKHIAHLGVGTFGWSFVNRQMEAPHTPVRVELTGPSGDLWAWGPEETKDAVSGPAEDFCLVVVQRRHVSDTNLTIKGETAARWMSIAQAFAGPPGPGRKARMFSKSNQ